MLNLEIFQTEEQWALFKKDNLLMLEEQVFFVEEWVDIKNLKDEARERGVYHLLSTVDQTSTTVRKTTIWLEKKDLEDILKWSQDQYPIKPWLIIFQRQLKPPKIINESNQSRSKFDFEFEIERMILLPEY